MRAARRKSRAATLAHRPNDATRYRADPASGREVGYAGRVLLLSSNDLSGFDPNRGLDASAATDVARIRS